RSAGSDTSRTGAVGWRSTGPTPRPSGRRSATTAPRSWPTTHSAPVGNGRSDRRRGAAPTSTRKESHAMTEYKKGDPAPLCFEDVRDGDTITVEGDEYKITGRAVTGRRLVSVAQEIGRASCRERVASWVDAGCGNQ